jgi:hypothetical protein
MARGRSWSITIYSTPSHPRIPGSYGDDRPRIMTGRRVASLQRHDGRHILAQSSPYVRDGHRGAKYYGNRPRAAPNSR